MKKIKGFTATHGLENHRKGPFFFWKDGKVTNSMTTSSWHHQNFILEYDDVDVVEFKNPNQMEIDFENMRSK